VNAELSADGIALTIAKIISPIAFDESQWKDDDAGMMTELQAGALCKAEKILALSFGFDDLPDDLQGAAGILDMLDCNSILADALKAAEASSADLVAYSALVTPMPDGTLLIAVLTAEPSGVDGEQDGVIVDRLASPEACQVAARIEVSAAGGGRA
jgi:hypothetical protein